MHKFVFLFHFIRNVFLQYEMKRWIIEHKWNYASSWAFICSLPAQCHRGTKYSQISFRVDIHLEKMCPLNIISIYGSFDMLNENHTIDRWADCGLVTLYGVGDRNQHWFRKLPDPKSADTWQGLVVFSWEEPYRRFPRYFSSVGVRKSIFENYRHIS